MDTPPPQRRSSRTVALDPALHDWLRLAAAHQSAASRRRVTIQELAESAIRAYLRQLGLGAPPQAAGAPADPA